MALTRGQILDAQEFNLDKETGPWWGIQNPSEVTIISLGRIKFTYLDFHFKFGFACNTDNRC